MVVKAVALMPLRGVVMPIKPDLKWDWSGTAAFLNGKGCELNIVDNVRITAQEILSEKGCGDSNRRQLYENEMVERTEWLTNFDQTKKEMVRYLDEVNRQGWGYCFIPEKFEPVRGKNRSVRQVIKESLSEVKSKYGSELI
jgi:hypothetical protein